MIRCGATVVVLLAASVVSASAGQYFERNGAAIEGYDPVAYFTEQKAVKGSPDFSAEHEGSTFYFASEAHREAFANDPEKFAPQYGGYCAYGMTKEYKAAIDLEALTVLGDRLSLNYSESVRAQWLSDVQGYVRQADANCLAANKLAKVRE